MALEEKADAAIVLSNRISQNGSLFPTGIEQKDTFLAESINETRARTESGLFLVYNGKADSLILSGGYADKTAPWTHAIAMAFHTRKLMYSETDPVPTTLEWFSLDSVSQLIFTKELIVKPKNMADLKIISHDYHVERIKTITEFVYGKDFKIEILGLETTPENRKMREGSERKSIETFKETFRGIAPANDEDIVSALYERHGLFIGKPRIDYPRPEECSLMNFL
ncbi:MAG: ElyC/SanA/YdcF family protein [Candidatus Nanoarchaeia archaeon]|nr:ElyC/SanA/YdcF family protein [Candidatus Nanoarchaeia archaeon]